MYVCFYVRMHVCMYACIRVCMYLCMYGAVLLWLKYFWLSIVGSGVLLVLAHGGRVLLCSYRGGKCLVARRRVMP